MLTRYEWTLAVLVAFAAFGAFWLCAIALTR